MTATVPLGKVFHRFQQRRRRSRMQPVATSPAAAMRRALPFLLGSLLLTLLPLVGQVPLWTLLIFAGCTAWRYRLEVTGRPLPSLLGRLLVFVPIAYLVLSTYGSNPSAQGLLAFLIALLSLKILELRTTRDFTIVALLGFFMVLAALFYEQSLSMCAFLGLILLLITMALIYCHGGLREIWPTARLAVGMGVQALPLVVLLFVVFPRVQGSFLHSFGGGKSGRMGMSDRLQPGSVSSLAQSNDPVFRATITPAPGQNVTQGQLYWRALVLDRCDQPLIWRSLPLPPAEPARIPSGVQQTITLFWNSQNWLYALDRPNFFKAESPPNLRVEFGSGQTLRSREPVFKTIIYTVYSSVGGDPKELLPDELRARYTHLPREIGPRSRELALGWKRNARNENDILRAATQFFGTNNFTYTLTPGLLPSTNALDYFLFESRRGFCEHYAAAYCTLMRAAGIPARVIVGYQGGEYNRWGVPHYLVRQSDAHAWAEVWLNGRGWVRQDPTGLVAPDRVSYGMEDYSALGGGLTDRLRLERLAQLNAPGSLRWVLRNASQIWDSVDEQWNQLVLGYNQDTQLSLMERLGLSHLDLLKGTLLTLVVAFGILAAGGAVIYLLERRSGHRGDPIQRLYARFCRKLAARAGLIRQPAEGPLDYGQRAAGALPAQAAEIRRITDLYVASRYARDGGRSEVEAFREAVGRFRVLSGSK